MSSQGGKANGGSGVLCDRWDDKEWDRLIGEIHDGNVVAVVGPELYTVEIEGQQVSLYGHLLGQLESALRLEPRETPRKSLHEVTCDYLQIDPGRNRTDDVRSKLCGIFNARSPLPPPAVCQLAEVRGIKLFVTTTADRLLEAAINQVRFQNRQGVSSLVMSLNKYANLPKPYDKLEEPVVFHPFGELLPRANACVVSDEDLLEFFFRLQGAGPSLDLLLDALRDNQLLFLGSTFADWVMRFFLRTAHNSKRLKDKEQRDYIVGKQLTDDPNFVRFLQLFARDTVISTQDPISFVQELRNRWVSQYPAPGRLEHVPLPVRMPEGAVFLSYASEDRDKVLRLKARLEEVGLTVWFDADQLMGGDGWEHKIYDNLVRCGFFCACISQNTEAPAARFNRFFREEWRQAADIARRSDHRYEYLIPILLDDLGDAPLSVPDEFPKKQMVKALDGRVSPEFLQRMVELARTRKEQRHGG